eukprot:403364566
MKTLPSFPSKINILCSISETKIVKRQKKLEQYFNQLVASGDIQIITFIERFCMNEDHSGQRKISKDFYNKSIILNDDFKGDDTRDDSQGEIDQSPYLQVKTLKSQISLPKMSLETQDTLTKESLSHIGQVNQPPMLDATLETNDKIDWNQMTLQNGDNQERRQSQGSSQNIPSNKCGKNQQFMNRLLSDSFIQLCNSIVNQTADNLIQIGFDQDDLIYESLHQNQNGFGVQLTKQYMLSKQIQNYKFQFETNIFDIPSGKNENLQLIDEFLSDNSKNQEMAEVQQNMGQQIQQIEQIMKQSDLKFFMQEFDLVQNFSNPHKKNSIQPTSISQLIGMRGMFQ